MVKRFLTDDDLLLAAYELWFKQILWELDSVREIFQNGHVSCYVTILLSHFSLRVQKILLMGKV